MKKPVQTSNSGLSHGFTLIELLIVIVLIGILSGVLLAVIQPGAQRARANEAVMRTNMDKIRMAALACNSARLSISSCNSWANIGVNNPAGTPTGSTYVMGYNSTGGYIHIRSCMDTMTGWTCPTGICTIQYRIFPDGTFTRDSTNCSIDLN